MITTKEIAIEAMRPLDLHTGDSLRVLEEREGFFVMQIIHAVAPAVPKRGSAGAWAREAQGTALLASGESRDDARMAFYREKYGIQ
jgi:hypothetical protein